jgi:NADPH:quinone reductase
MCAEYVLVPARQVTAFRSELSWEQLGAVPEMLQTAHGSLTIGVQAQPGDKLLIRGGTSSVGMALTMLAKRQASRCSRRPGGNRPRRSWRGSGSTTC